MFQTAFRVKLKFFSGAVSFCRRAALKSRAGDLTSEREEPFSGGAEMTRILSDNNKGIAKGGVKKPP